MKVGAAIQQPDETLDYDFLYADWFNDSSDEIVSFTADAVPAGLTLIPLLADVDRGKIWVSGGVDGTTYYIGVTATTSGGRVKQDELEIIFQEFV